MRGRLVFVESNTTGSGMLALRAAKELGLRPLFLTSEPARYTGLAAAGPDIVLCDTNSPAALLDTVRRLQGEEIAGITTTSDFYLIAVAELAEALGLSGNPPGAVWACRDKAATRMQLAAAGVRQPGFAVVKDATAVEAAVRQVGLPCVVKPVDDTGSTGVRICRTLAEALEQCAPLLVRGLNVRGQPAGGTALVEEYLDGPEYSVEMFSWDGHAQCVGITEKSLTGFPYCVEWRHIFPAPVEAKMAVDIAGTVQAALAAIGFRQGPTHTEIKITPSGPAIVEINPRLAGGMIPELIRLVTGTDMLEQQIRCATAAPPILPTVYKGHAGIQFLGAKQQGVLRHITGLRHAQEVAGVVAADITAKPGAGVRPPRSSYDRIGFVIAQGESRGDVAQSLAEASSRVQAHLMAKDHNDRTAQ
jgi:S-sulfo-L-cysteine synthase (3-phospho-L-serine-dependent)